MPARWPASETPIRERPNARASGFFMSQFLNPNLLSILRRATGAREVRKAETIQTLWSGYGSLDRYHLKGADMGSVVVKHVQLRSGRERDLSHRRKLRSYQVETRWYEQWAARCGEGCRVPHCLHVEHLGEEVIMVLEDLDTAGFPVRRGRVDPTSVSSCLRWLAEFHATFLGKRPDGLWPIGTYWHLETRPDELAAMEPGELKEMAAEIDRQLRAAPFQTLVHGDAKLANFCFSRDGQAVAAVDFQYVGGGCGMRDVAYFIDSCFPEAECERREAELLDLYFSALRGALARLRPETHAAEVEAAWRPLYAVAWADFYRFMKGWSPGYRGHYSERMAARAVRWLRLRASA